MIKPKNKECVECGRNDQPWFSKKRCKSCAQKSYAKSSGSLRASSPPKRTSIKKNFKPTGEGALFEAIWATREHRSFVSGVKLKQPNASMFAHCLPKSHYGKFRLYEKNIVLLTPDEHHLYDAGTQQQRDKYAEQMWEQKNILVDWEKLYMLAEQLKQEYNIS